MTNHPSRNKRAAKRGPHPTGAEIRQTREEYGHTQTEAAESICVAMRTWQDYEGEKRKMPPGLWEYYCLQCAFPREMGRLIRRWRKCGADFKGWHSCHEEESMSEIKIIDRQSLQEFEKLLGFKINGNVVKLPHDVYVKHAAAIQGIQMGAAFRIKR